MDISFITINYNGYEDTHELLSSIYSNVRSVSYEVIVVDNASENKEEIASLKRDFPEATCIRSEKNLGFAGGNNRGIDKSSGNFVMLINNDTLVNEDHFNELLDRFRNNPGTGAISPKIVFYSPSGFIQFAGYRPLSKITLRNSSIGYMEPDDGRYNDAHITPYCHGAAMIVPRNVIEKAGKMSETFFLYYEEIDWSTTISEHGYSLWYDPIQTIIHKESRSAGNDSPLKTFYMTRNRLLYAYRHLGGKYMMLSIIYQIFASMPKNVILYIMRWKWRNALAVIRGAANFFIIRKEKP
ncbi:MAG: glycosyltransferase family 2 protein [Bacteroidales bacterium]|jgi:GT2 family glycosyltransferase|nr:glycosyltransferase family 2 protein [Bacteroidales bacterium]